HSTVEGRRDDALGTFGVDPRTEGVAADTDRTDGQPGLAQLPVGHVHAVTCWSRTQSEISPRKWARNASCSCFGYVDTTVSTSMLSKSGDETQSSTIS